MNSYQRRQREIVYFRQRGKQLEEIVFDLARQMKRAGIEPRIPLGRGLSGDEIITDISSGQFAMRLMCVSDEP